MILWVIVIFFHIYFPHRYCPIIVIFPIVIFPLCSISYFPLLFSIVIFPVLSAIFLCFSILFLSNISFFFYWLIYTYIYIYTYNYIYIMSHFPIVFQCYYTILVISLFFSKPLGGAFAFCPLQDGLSGHSPLNVLVASDVSRVWWVFPVISQFIKGS